MTEQNEKVVVEEANEENKKERFLCIHAWTVVMINGKKYKQCVKCGKTELY